MALTISDLDDFNLSDLDDFTLQELDNMTYEELVDAVEKKNQVVMKVCDQSMVLTEEQAKIIVSVVRTYDEEKSKSIKSGLTVQVATSLITMFIAWCANQTISHLPEIIETLKQAYLLLLQIIH